MLLLLMVGYSHASSGGLLVEADDTIDEELKRLNDEMALLLIFGDS